MSLVAATRGANIAVDEIADNFAFISDDAVGSASLFRSTRLRKMNFERLGGVSFN